MSKIAKRWMNDKVCFTVNNYTMEDQMDFQGNNNLTYLVYGFEVGSSGTPHMQGYLECNKRHDGAWYHNNVCANGIYSPREGTLEQAVNYCKKGEQSHEEWTEWKKKGGGWNGPNYGKNANFIEQGTPSKKERVGQGKRTDFDKVKDKMKTGATLTETMNICTGYQQMKVTEMLFKYKSYDKRFYPKTVKWYYGATGCGKSTKAEQEAYEYCPTQAPYIHARNASGFMNSYEGQKVAIFDDMRWDTFKFDVLLRLLDRYPMRVDVKGSSVIWEPELIIITTPRSIRDTFIKKGKKYVGGMQEEDVEHEDIEQVIRRVNGGELEFTHRWKEVVEVPEDVVGDARFDKFMEDLDKELDKDDINKI